MQVEDGSEISEEISGDEEGTLSTGSLEEDPEEVLEAWIPSTKDKVDDGPRNNKTSEQKLLKRSLQAASQRQAKLITSSRGKSVVYVRVKSFGYPINF